MAFWVVASGAALVYWMLSLKVGHGWLRSGIKGLTVAPLALMALIQGAPLVALALALCSLGDVVLSRPGQGAFLAGLIAFALGHLAWIVVFFANFTVSPALLSDPLRLGLLGALAVLAFFMARLLIPRAGPLKEPVAVYLGIIMAMAVTALATPPFVIVVGAMLFAASDSLLGLQTFVLQHGMGRERIANALIWPLYWAAIALLTLGALG